MTRQFWAQGLLAVLLSTVGVVFPVSSAAAQTAGGDDPREMFEKGFVDFESSVVVTGSPALAGRLWLPYQGKYHRRLDGVDIYEAIERPDLAASYRRRRAIEWTLLLGGWAAIIGSPYLAVHSQTHLGGVLFLLGVSSVIAGWILEPDPVSEWEAREAADLYNKKLLRRLRLDPASPESAPGRTMTFVPSLILGPGGAGLALAFTF